MPKKYVFQTSKMRHLSAQIIILITDYYYGSNEEHQ